MTQQPIPQPRSGLVTGSRWVLLILAALFTLGAFGQFFLVGMSMFDDATRWKDHATLGHILGLLPYVMWIPAVLGRAGFRLVLGTLLLLVLFMAQYAFINVDSGIANAFHPLNGSLLLVLGFWITCRGVKLVREESPTIEVASTGARAAGMPEKLERTVL